MNSDYKFITGSSTPDSKLDWSLELEVPRTDNMYLKIQRGRKGVKCLGEGT